jgi:hypothetical protein
MQALQSTHEMPAIDAATKQKNPAYQAFQILHLGFVVAPALAGIDKFVHLLVDWDKYVPRFVSGALGAGGTHAMMLAVGVVEMAAAAIVAVRPRIGAYVVAAWLVAIIGALVMTGQYFDVALRDLGLALAALALGRLASVYAPSRSSAK